MAAVEHDFEKSLVCIWVGGEVSGTGFVVAPGKVLTCAHVVCDKVELKTKTRYTKTTRPIQIEFYLRLAEQTEQNKSVKRRRSTDAGSAKSTSRSKGSAEVPVDPVDAKIAVRPWSPVDKYDIAVLEFEEELPEGVVTAVFSSAELKGGTPCHSRGFAQVGIEPSIFADDIIITATNGTRDGKATLQIDSNKIKRGHSGAPLCELYSGHVLGMIDAIAPMDPHGKLQNVAFAIPNSTLRRIVKGLKVADESGRQFHGDALARLRQLLEAALEADTRVTRDFCKLAGYTGKSEELRERIPDLVNRLLEQSVDAAVSQLVKLDQQYKAVNAKQARRTMSRMYGALVPAILEPTLVRTLRTQVLEKRNRVVVIPSSTRTIVSLVMAGVDGRLGRFRAGGAVKRPPVGTLEVPVTPERGIGKMNLKSLHSVLADTLKVALEDLEDPSKMLQALLKLREDKNERLYIVVKDHKTEFNVDSRKQIEGAFPYLVLVEMTKPSDAQDDLHTSVIAPLLDDNFLNLDDK